MLKNQTNIGQDALCHQIVNLTLNDLWFDLSDAHFPVVSQSWVQWEFRNQGYEIQCHGLDLFPTNTIQLKKLLYKV